jgi:hypothetical protein
MFRDWMSKFFAEYRSSQTWWRLGDTPTVAGYFLQGPGPVKNLEFTAHVVFYPIVGAQDQISNFLKKTGPQKPVNAC